MPTLRELADKRIIVGDGATGTVLHNRLPKGASIDLAVIEHPDELLKLYVEYIKAGSMVIQTHTFGTSKAKLDRKNALDMFEELNSKAVKIAREAGWEMAKEIYSQSRQYASGVYLIAPYKRGETILQLVD